MDLGTKQLNDLISKDFNTARQAALELVNSKDIETFEKLAQSAECLFDFIREKVLNLLIDAVDINNYKNLLAFLGTYSADFEDFVVLPLVKFASQDLTDEMLELFENATEPAKAYCAAYFASVHDPLCVEFLNKYALSTFEPLASNCARALASFNERALYNEMLEKLSSDAEDFEKNDAANFLVSYGDTSALMPLVDFMQKGSLPQNAAANILALKSFSKMLEDNEANIATEVFDNILEGYPEILPLTTLVDWQIPAFLRSLLDMPRESYTDRIILKAKAVFKMIAEDDIYTYDLDKNAKNAILQIQKMLEGANAPYKESLPKELSAEPKRAIKALDVISELNLKNLAPDVAKLANEAALNSNLILICQCAKTLKDLGTLDLVDISQLEKNIADTNILAIIDSYFA